MSIKTGTRIRFLRTIEEPTEIQPMALFASAGQGGIVCGPGCEYEYSVKADDWPQAFGANANEFEVAEAGR